MRIKQTSMPSKSESERTRNAIRDSWSPRERNKRRRLAIARQQLLFTVLTAHPEAVSANVA